MCSWGLKAHESLRFTQIVKTASEQDSLLDLERLPAVDVYHTVCAHDPFAKGPRENCATASSPQVVSSSLPAWSQP